MVQHQPKFGSLIVILVHLLSVNSCCMNKRTFLVLLLLSQFSLLVCAQTNYPVPKANVSNNTGKDTTDVLRLLAQAESFKQQNRSEEAAAYYDKALALLNANGDRQGIAAVFPDYSEVKMMQAQLPAAEDMLKESIRLSKELGIDRLQWQYGLLGAVQTQRRELVEALKNELLAIKIGEQYRDTSSRMAEIYNYAAIIYGKMGKPEESGQYLRKAIGTGSHSRDPMLTVQLRSNLAGILIRQNKLKEALENLNILEKTYEKDLQFNAKIQMLSRFVRCYTELNDLADAARYANQLIECSNGIKPDEYDQLIIYTELNRYLIANQRIVLEAKRMAKAGACLKQIAYELGYEDVSAFSKLFKRVAGETFSNYRCNLKFGYAKLKKISCNESNRDII